MKFDLIQRINENEQQGFDVSFDPVDVDVSTTDDVEKEKELIDQLVDIIMKKVDKMDVEPEYDTDDHEDKDEHGFLEPEKSNSDDQNDDTEGTSQERDDDTNDYQTKDSSDEINSRY